MEKSELRPNLLRIQVGQKRIWLTLEESLNVYNQLIAQFDLFSIEIEDDESVSYVLESNEGFNDS